MLEYKAKELSADPRIWELYVEAGRDARKGLPGHVRDALQESRELARVSDNYAALLFIDSAQSRMLRIAYKQSIFALYAHANQQSSQGDIFETASTIRTMQDHASKGKVRLDDSAIISLAAKSVEAAVSSYLEANPHLRAQTKNL